MRKSRRQFLLGVSASAVIGLSGCLTDDDSTSADTPTQTQSRTTTGPNRTATTSEEREYWELSVLNQLETDVTVHVTVSDNERTISEFRSPVTASEDITFANAIPTYDGEEDIYTITVQADTREASRSITVDRSFRGILVRIQPEQIRIVDIEQ